MTIGKAGRFLVGLAGVSAAALLVAAYGFAPVDPVAVVKGKPQEAARVVNVTPEPFGPSHVFPEGFAVLDDERIAVAAGNGDVTILRVAADGSVIISVTLATLGGHGIGLFADPATGFLWSATYPGGLDRIEADGSVTRATSEVGTSPIGFADDVATGPDGILYLTDGSTRFNKLTTPEGSPNIFWDLLEGRPNGRLLAYDPATGTTRLAASDLYFPSGVIVSPDGSALLVAEISGFRLLRLPFTATGLGAPEVLADNLPGIPDDVFSGPDGHIWLSLPAKRNAMMDEWLRPHPFLARLVSLLPPSLLAGSGKGPGHGGSLLRIGDDGALLCRIELPPGVPVANGAAFGDRILLGRLGDGPLLAVDPAACDS